MGSALLLCALLLVLCTHTSAFNIRISTHTTNSRLINARGRKLRQQGTSTDIASQFHHTGGDFTRKHTISRASYSINSDGNSDGDDVEMNRRTNLGRRQGRCGKERGKGKRRGGGASLFVPAKGITHKHSSDMIRGVHYGDISNTLTLANTKQLPISF